MPKERKLSLNKKGVSGGSRMKIVQSSNAEMTVNDEFEEWKRARQLLKPPDQLPLSDLELKEEIARVLSCTNPLRPHGLIEFSYANGTYLPQPSPGNTVVILDIKGTSLHKESEEAKQQIAEFGIETELEAEEEEEGAPKSKDEGIEDMDEGEEEAEGEEDVGGEGKGDEDEEIPVAGPKKKLTNQFNFCERAALTYNNPNRSQETQTIPAPRADFSNLVLQWIIYDEYEKDYAIQQKEKEKEKKVLMIPKKGLTRAAKKSGEKEEFQARIFVAWKTLERMVNLNTYDDIAKDYRYWEDPSDEFRDEEGTLLPLWKFSYEKTKKSMITDIMWNPWYYDLFVVAFGTFEYRAAVQGAVCLFTIKNPSYPEHICLTQTPVMCIDTHPKYPFMIVCGMYKGGIFVYNVTISCKVPEYTTNAVSNKHRGLVSTVKWGPDLQDGEMNFYSVAGDGQVNNWILMQNELSKTTIITLYLETDPVPGPDSTFVKLKSSASCMEFHPSNPEIFLVGTEEGLIYKCSTLYSATYLFTYYAHHMPVYRLDYNKFNSSIFASCSGDWRIKIWEDERAEPLYVFDLGSPIGDCRWAPYSSTVFGVVTQKGRVYIFDLNINKYRAVCKQNIVSKKKTKLTRLCFNVKLPIIIVGDDRGCIHTVKLSPNLRIPCKAPKKQQHLDQFTLQCMKLDKLLTLVREPPVLTPPEDVETIRDD